MKKGTSSNKISQNHLNLRPPLLRNQPNLNSWRDLLRSTYHTSEIILSFLTWQMNGREKITKSSTARKMTRLQMNQCNLCIWCSRMAMCLQTVTVTTRAGCNGFGYQFLPLHILDSGIEVLGFHSEDSFKRILFLLLFRDIRCSCTIDMVYIEFHEQLWNWIQR